MDDDIAAVRDFNRFWTRQIGVLTAGLLESPFSLTEARVLFELAQRQEEELAGLRSRLDLDAGYVSRIVSRLRELGLVESKVSGEDSRKQILWLTAAGRDEAADLDRRSSDQVAAMLDGLEHADRTRLVESMARIRRIFEPATTPSAIVIRPLRPGDLGWVVGTHGLVYSEEYGWDLSFEALVAGIVSDYVEHHDPVRENAWVAELDGRSVGCVFCVAKSEETAQLRILVVDPQARGHGIGSRLVAECIDFARRAGYRTIVLWTNDVLVSARRIYEAAGFTLVAEEPHHSFGQDLVGQTWELVLRRTTSAAPAT